jgi:hypothetical protein
MITMTGMTTLRALKMLEYYNLEQKQAESVIMNPLGRNTLGRNHLGISKNANDDAEESRARRSEGLGKVDTMGRHVTILFSNLRGRLASDQRRGVSVPRCALSRSCRLRLC